jgi:NitT/TauT family transport system ATP-binding protein
MQTPNIAIKCDQVSVVFRNRTSEQRVLDHLDISVPRGQIVSLLGPSGCGKSTLLRVVAGLITPASGTINVEGKSVETSRDKLAFVFQEAALLPWRTVWQNVMLPWEIRGAQPGSKQPAPSKDQLREAIEKTLTLVGFKPTDWHKKPSQLSGGMKMRASIARALITQPDILLLDEPFAALDDMLRSKLNDLLLDIVSQTGCTMLFVTHNISEAIYLSHRIAVMSHGKIADTIDVDLPCPRESGVRGTPAFAGLYGQVAESLARSNP